MKSIIATLLTVMLATSALAHANATGIVRERMDAMKEMNEAVKALGLMRDGGLPFTTELLSRAAGIIEGHAVTMPDQYPEGSFDAPSEALPAIATNRADFDAQALALAALASTLSTAPDLDTARPQIVQLGQSCQTCHRLYRED